MEPPMSPDFIGETATTSSHAHRLASTGLDHDRFSPPRVRPVAWSGRRASKTYFWTI